MAARVRLDGAGAATRGSAVMRLLHATAKPPCSVGSATRCKARGDRRFGQQTIHPHLFASALAGLDGRRTIRWATPLAGVTEAEPRACVHEPAAAAAAAGPSR